MEVLHINSNYLTSRLHENLVGKLDSKGINNTIFMPIKNEKKAEFLYESKHAVHAPVTFRDMDKYIFTYKQRKIRKKLIDTVNVSEFDMVHSHTLFTDGYVAYQLYKKYNIPYLVTVRGHTDIKQFFKLRFNLRGIGRKILSSAARIVFLSESNRKELLNDYINNDDLRADILDKSVVLPNGIDDFWFENEGQPKQLPKNRPLRVIYVGKTMRLKNLLGTVRALNCLKKAHGIDSIYTSIGQELDKSYAKEVRSEVEMTYHELAARPREELITHYRENDLFIMPSFSETFGLVYPEAMSQGLPVIYTKEQGFDGQFEDGLVGYPVDPRSSEDIVDKIIMILNNYEDISKETLKSYKKFNWEDISYEYLDLYKEIVK